MIKITGMEKVMKVYDRMQYKDEQLRLKVTAQLYAVKEYIEAGLQELFSEHNDKHFEVQLNFGGSGSYNITIVADDIGKYIYYGTEEHFISSSGPMPLWGGSAFAYSVSHPGQESRQEEIDQIVADAFEIMWTSGESDGGAIWAF